jgi:hypothetical protein
MISSILRTLRYRKARKLILARTPGYSVRLARLANLDWYANGGFHSDAQHRVRSSLPESMLANIETAYARRLAAGLIA